MRNVKRSVAWGATGFVIALAGAVCTAPPASAGSGNYIGFTNNGWFVVDTCYKWQSSTTPDSCDYAKPINTDWRGGKPEDETGVRGEVNGAGQVAGGNVAPQITDLNRSHCYELKGTTFGPSIAKKDC
ncbi:hypothetical protein HRW11_20545 [Streptomyces lunaelactis]|uniref:hypothetical protein n=1 Tax=Streptomyces lunaelactis TaxID=1535768 RepID=UPI001585C025|nr:hypothetical protein [Streptomyces lunaelactis]NUK66433.1 hypothetical protein [Streptomyces lunaelactis]